MSELVASPSRAGLPAIGGQKARRAEDALRRAILSRALPPGSQLLEQSLAGELGCSQGTVREALLRLADEGLVERRGYRGTFVTETTLHEAASMVRVRLSIEREAATRLARHGAGAARPALDALLAEMDRAHEEGDLGRCAGLDRAFHVEMARAAGMALLCPMLSRCALHIHRFTLGGLEVAREFVAEAGLGDDHRALLARVLAGPPASAAEAVTQHLAEVLGRWAPSLLEAAGPEVGRGVTSGGARS